MFGRRRERQRESRALTSLTDAELARRAPDDRAAFAELYRRYVEPVHAYCLRRLGAREAAEDVTATVFLKALAAIERYREESGSVRAWLFTIAYRSLVDDVRARRALARWDDGLDPPSAADGPEEETLARDAARELRTLLAEQPVADRELLELRLAGLSDGEIGAVLGKSPGAVRVAQHRAIARLRERVGAHPRGAERG